MPTIDIDREAAREAARHELAKPIYPRQSPRQQVIDFIEALLHQLIVKGSAIPGGWFTISVLFIILVAALTAGIRIARRTLRSGGADHPVFGDAELSAAQHRSAAEHCAASEDWADATRHRLRAVARELEQSGVLSPIPGRTANELARAAGEVLPELAAGLADAAGIFNDVSYGQLPATQAGYRAIAELDDRLCSAVTVAAGPWRRSS